MAEDCQVIKQVNDYGLYCAVKIQCSFVVCGFVLAVTRDFKQETS